MKRNLAKYLVTILSVTIILTQINMGSIYASTVLSEANETTDGISLNSASENDVTITDTQSDNHVSSDSLPDNSTSISPSGNSVQLNSSLSDNTASENRAVSTDSVSLNAVSSNSVSVNEVEEVSVEDRVIVLEDKGSEEEAIEELPDTWSVTLEDGSEKEVDIKWECMDDFDDDQYTSFVFQAVIDDEEVSPEMKEDDEQKLTMEVYFENEVKSAEDVIEEEGHELSGGSDVPISICMLSPNSLIPNIEKEQGTAEPSEDFLEAYGSNADSVIDSVVSYRESGTVLSNSTYNLFQSISPSSGSYLYSNLSPAQKALYDKLDAWVTQYLYYGKEPTKLSGQPMTAFISGTDLTPQQAIGVCELYYFNNPEAFFLTTQYYTQSGTDGGYSVAIAFLPYTDTPSELKNAAETIASNINSLYNSYVAPGKGDYEKVKRAHDALCERITYDSYNGTSTLWTDFVPGNLFYEQSLMSVFYDNRKRTVCAGYSKANTALMRMIGLDAFSITSTSHEWNKVYLYGQWYCTDVTWDDMSSVYTRDYFLKSDTSLSSGNATHNWDNYWYGIAPSSPSDYNPATEVYSITYYLDGGTNDRTNPTNYTSSTGTITLKPPTRAGYTFGGWYLDSAYRNQVTTIKGSDRRDYVLYAKWTANRSTSNTSNTASNTSNSTDKVKAFVTRLYRTALEREPDYGGLSWWTAELKSGGKTGADVVRGFFLSSELMSRGYNNNKMVELAYKGIMGRNPDTGGYTFWVNEMNSGQPYENVVNGFIGSPEFLDLCADYGITPSVDSYAGVRDFVSRLYTEALGRTYDAGGLAFWTDVILNDPSRQNVLDVALNGFLHSVEFEGRNLSNAEYLKVLYHTFLGREPDTGGYYFWLLALNTGTSRDEVARGFAFSVEFDGIMASYGL